MVSGAATFSSSVTSQVTASAVFIATSGTTSRLYSVWANTGNNSYFGIESSTGGNLFTGSSAYATVLGTDSARSLEFATNNNIRLSIASTGAATFSSSVSTGSDLYVNGNSVIGNSNAGTTSAGTTRLTLQNTTLTNSRGIGFYANDGTQNPRSWIKHITASGSQYVEFNSDYSSASSYSNFVFLNGNVNINNTANVTYRLYVDGTIYATGDITASSDARYKTNIRPIENALAKIVGSRGVIYDRINEDSVNNIGFIAQELEVYFPELVSTDNQGFKGVKYQNAVAVLFEGIKEQQKQIEELKILINGFTS